MQQQNGTSRVLIGESYVGDGAEAAHLNTAAGHRDGPAGACTPTRAT